MELKQDISVVVPTIGRQTLIRTIGSLDYASQLSQLSIRILIVYDGVGTADNFHFETGNHVKLDYISTGGGKGAPFARNKGLERVDTEFVIFIDDDDWVSENYFEYYRYLMMQNQTFDIIISRSKVVIENAQMKIPWSQLLFKWMPNKCIEIMNFWGASFLIKTSCIESIKGFDERLKVAQDWDLALRLHRSQKIIVKNIDSFVYSDQTSDLRITNQKNLFSKYKYFISKNYCKNVSLRVLLTMKYWLKYTL